MNNKDGQLTARKQIGEIHTKIKSFSFKNNFIYHLPNILICIIISTVLLISSIILADSISNAAKQDQEKLNQAYKDIEVIKDKTATIYSIILDNKTKLKVKINEHK